MTAGEAIARYGYPVCEWNPFAQRPARTKDGYHGLAVSVLGQISRKKAEDDRQLRVCQDCAALPEVLAYVTRPGTVVRARSIEGGGE